jgi:transcriptional regulator with XRE-family HTH domain
MDVKALREMVGWSQRELADYLETSQSLVARVERGDASFDDGMAGRLESLSRRTVPVRRLDSILNAPAGGRKGTKGAAERLAWVNERNRRIQLGVVKGPNPGPVTG